MFGCLMQAQNSFADYFLIIAKWLHLLLFTVVEMKCDGVVLVVLLQTLGDCISSRHCSVRSYRHSMQMRTNF